jgi:hypothetical protein
MIWVAPSAVKWLALSVAVAQEPGNGAVATIHLTNIRAAQLLIANNRLEAAKRGRTGWLEDFSRSMAASMIGAFSHTCHAYIVTGGWYALSGWQESLDSIHSLNRSDQPLNPNGLKRATSAFLTATTSWIPILGENDGHP